LTGAFTGLDGLVTVVGVKLGKGSIIGAGSVVKKDVKPGDIVVGNPAKFLKKNTKMYNLKIF
jgi:acetyltransferase-like isoleucine patch superfamily enzyme